jgi:hypothetical protein
MGGVEARIERLRLAAQRIGLPAWFVTIDVAYQVFNPDAFAIDARHYQRAAEAWLAGGNPWTVTEQGVLYAAGPHTLLFYAPTSLLPLPAAVGLWMAAGLVASVWLVRRLHLPLWWLAFPPLAHAIWNGNPQTIALALLVLGGPVAATLAVGLKLYAAVPLLARWRQLVVAAIVLAASLVVLPVGQYLAAGAGVSDHLDSAWNGSAWRVPLLVPPTLLALWLLRRHGAEWLAVPAVWPATQLYYNAMALPALVGRPALAAALAIPVPLMPAIAVMAFAVTTYAGRSRRILVGTRASDGHASGRTPTSTTGDSG